MATRESNATKAYNMKRVQLFMGTALTLPMLIFTPVVVHAATTPTSTTTTTTTTTTPAPTTTPSTTSTKKTTTTTTEKTLTPAQRLEKYKTTYTVTLTPIQQASLKIKCKAAQAKGKTLAANVTKNNMARTAAYTQITTKLDKLILKLKDADYDTKTLESQRAELQTLITKYTTDLATYQNALTDMNDVDCITDTSGFKASLEASRAARVVVAKDAQAIRTYINETIKVSLKAAKTALTKDTTNNQTEGAQ